MITPSASIEQVAKHYMEIDVPDHEFRIDTRRYFDPEFYAAERQAIWQNQWQVACREDDLANPGDWLEHRVIDQSYVLVRDDKGSVRAFHNACRHRGNRLCVGRGNALALTCPFHLWQYNLDGSLRHVPDRETFIRFDDRQYGLHGISCGSWGGFVFINPDPHAEPLARYLDPIAPYLEGYRLADMAPVSLNVSQRLKCNWKVVMDAFSESYHVQGLHAQNLPMANDIDRRFAFFGPHRAFVAPYGSSSPRLGPLSEDEVVEAFGIVEKLFKGPDAANPVLPLVEPYRGNDGVIRYPPGISLRLLAQRAARATGKSQGLNFSQLTDDQLVDNVNVLIFPNTTLNLRAGAMTYFAARPDPNGDPEVCLFDAAVYQLFTDPEERRAKRLPQREIPPDASMGLIIDQDREMMPRQQIGLRDRSLDHLLLSRQEVGVAHFHKTLDAQLARGKNQRNAKLRTAS